VVKKEILKLLKADIIYHISDSKWVTRSMLPLKTRGMGNLVHVVPKKGGITVVRNEYNELIPT